MFYIQDRTQDYGKWRTWIARPFETVDEAKAFLDERGWTGYKTGVYIRIVQSYTVTRYKAVKV